MSYQQTTETDTYPRPAAMYNLPQSRSSYGQGQTQNNENLPINAMLSQFAGMAIPTAANTSAGNAASSTSQFYMTADGQYFMAPAGMCTNIFPWYLIPANDLRSCPSSCTCSIVTTSRECL